MTRAREMLAWELVTDVVGEVLTFGIGAQEVAIQLEREIEVAVEFAGAEAQVEDALSLAYAAAVNTLESKGSQSTRSSLD